MKIPIPPPWVDSSKGPNWENRQNFDIFWIFPVHGKNGLRWPQIGSGGFFPTNPDLADILAERILILRSFILFHFLDPKFLDFQVPKIWISRLPEIWISRSPKSGFPDFQKSGFPDFQKSTRFGCGLRWVAGVSGRRFGPWKHEQQDTCIARRPTPPRI